MINPQGNNADTPVAEAAQSRSTLDRLPSRSPRKSVPIADEGSEHESRVVQLPLDRLRPSSNQPRHLFDDEAIAQLAQSLEHYGVLQPLLVKQLDSGDYEILAGERRWRAARRAQLKTVPCLVRAIDDDETLEVALVENIQRRDLTPIEEAQALADLIAHHHYTHDELSSRLGIPRASVTNSLRLLQLPEPVRDMVHTGRLTAGHAKAILTLPSDSQREILAVIAEQKALSVRRTEQLAKSMAEENIADAVQRPALSPNLRHLCDQYKGHLGTKVKITGNPERGRIEISYYSQEDLDRITELVLGSELR